MSVESCNGFESIDELYSEIELLLPIQEGFGTFSDTGRFDLPWELIGEISPYKIKLIHHDEHVYIKSFSPKAEKFTQAYFAALAELSSLPITIPILPAIGVRGSSIFFCEGIDSERYGSGLLQEEIYTINEIVSKYKLRSSIRNSLLITMDNGIYLADPIEDSTYYIDNFVNDNLRNFSVRF
jgi:hypothetical protein